MVIVATAMAGSFILLKVALHITNRILTRKNLSWKVQGFIIANPLFWVQNIGHHYDNAYSSFASGIVEEGCNSVSMDAPYSHRRYILGMGRNFLTRGRVNSGGRRYNGGLYELTIPGLVYEVVKIPVKLTRLLN